jgi:hypothetical protein
MSIESQRGLSAHERHAHSTLRNAKRREAGPLSENWTVEEVTFLKELEETYKNHRFPNVEISKFLTSKTIDFDRLIKYKRRKLKLASEEASLQKVAQEIEGGCDPVNPGNACSQEPEINGDESILEWRLDLVKEIETPTEVPPVLREVNDRLKFIWQHEQGNREALVDEINNFICTSLYGAIRRTILI